MPRAPEASGELVGELLREACGVAAGDMTGEMAAMMSEASDPIRSITLGPASERGVVGSEGFLLGGLVGGLIGPGATRAAWVEVRVDASRALARWARAEAAPDVGRGLGRDPIVGSSSEVLLGPEPCCSPPDDDDGRESLRDDEPDCGPRTRLPGCGSTYASVIDSSSNEPESSRPRLRSELAARLAPAAPDGPAPDL